MVSESWALHALKAGDPGGRSSALPGGSKAAKSISFVSHRESIVRTTGRAFHSFLLFLVHDRPPAYKTSVNGSRLGTLNRRNLVFLRAVHDDGYARPGADAWGCVASQFGSRSDWWATNCQRPFCNTHK